MNMTTEEIVIGDAYEYVNDRIDEGFPSEYASWLYDAYMAGASDAYYLAYEEM